jgi:hypothetical protein
MPSPPLARGILAKLSEGTAAVLRDVDCGRRPIRHTVGRKIWRLLVDSLACWNVQELHRYHRVFYKLFKRVTVCPSSIRLKE